MSPLHFANIAVHVAASAISLGIGFAMLAKAKGTLAHRRLGRRFGYATLVVCGSAATGLIFFRFIPVFAVLTVLVLYQLVGGWRLAHTQERGPAGIDAVWTLLAAVCSAALVPHVLGASTESDIVVRSSLGALTTILA